MFDDTIETPRELFTHKLGAALTMEQTVLGMLAELEEAAQRTELKQQFRHHADETQQQIRNLEQSFRALGIEVEEKPCPAIEGLEKEGQQLIKMSDEAVVDAVILGSAAETEHHEIAVYDTLITMAEALGAQDVAVMLNENLEQEEHTLREVEKASQQVAQQLATTTA
jgi:ferritin-like metal-binding protein YciE